MGPDNRLRLYRILHSPSVLALNFLPPASLPLESLIASPSPESPQQLSPNVSGPLCLSVVIMLYKPLAKGRFGRDSSIFIDIHPHPLRSHPFGLPLSRSGKKLEVSPSIDRNPIDLRNSGLGKSFG